MWSDIDLVVDGGTLVSDVGSTVVSLNQSEYKVIRKGRCVLKSLKIFTKLIFLDLNII